MKRAASSLLILFLLRVPAVLATTVSIHLSDYAVNPGQVIEVWGTVENNGSPLENRLVTISLDGSLVSFSWAQPAWEGLLENLQITGEVLKLSYRADYDLAYVDENGYLSTVDVDGNVRNLGILASRVGTMIDPDGDGDQDLFYLADNGYICSVDNSGNVHTYPRTATDIGGVCDFDNNGSLDILYVYNNYPYYVPLAGGTPTQLLSLTTGRIGFCGRFLPSIDRIYAPITLPDASGVGCAAKGGYWDWTGAGGTPLDVGTITDFDGDGIDNDLLFVSTGGLGYFDNNKAKIWISAASGAKGVGGAIDWDVDGDLDAVFMASDNTVKLVDKSGNLINLGVRARDVGGIVDFDNDTGYRLSGRYTCVKDWGTPHFRPENMTVSVSIPLAGASISVLVELSDNQDFFLVKENCSFTLSSSGTTTQNFSFENLCRYTRLTFTFQTPSKANTPSLNSSTLRSRVYTDNEGGYSFPIRAPTQLGEHWVGVEVEDNENSASFDVRRLVFDNFFLLDNHGQLDNILNPGENYRLTVRIREDNSSQFHDITSGSFTLRLNGQNYSLEHWENSIWRTQTSFTAPTSLGSYSIQVENIWGYSGENIVGSTTATYTYKVKTIEAPINFYKTYTGAQPWYNPNENFQIYGTLTLRPDGTPVSGVTVRIYENTGADWEYRGENQADSGGNYSFTLTSPSTLGPRQVRVTTSENGIEGENIRTYYVKTLTLTVELDKYSVQPGELVKASGVATMWPEGMTIANQKVELWVGLHDNFELTKEKKGENWTNSSGAYTIYFNAPEYTGTFRVLAQMKTTPEEIENENYCLMSSAALRISLNLSPVEATPGQSIEAWGSAWFEPGGNPLQNHPICIQKWQGADEEVVYTDSNGNWPSTGHYIFTSPSTWGRWTFKVYADYYELHGENSRTYDTNAVELTDITFTDNTENDWNERIVNPGESVQCTGRAMVRPDNTPVTTGTVKYKLSWEGTTKYAGINENGYFSISFNAPPSSVGVYQVIFENVTGFSYYMLAQRSENLEVRTLLLSEVLDKDKVDGGAQVNVSGTVLVQAAGGASWPLAGEKFHVYLDNVEVLPVEYTTGDGTYSKMITAPYTSGEHKVKVRCVDENGIWRENIKSLWVERILISVSLYEGPNPSNGAVRPDQPNLRVSGRAWYEFSGEAVENTVHIYLDGNEKDQVQTDNGGNYSYTFTAPSGLGPHELKVFIRDGDFSRENSLYLYVRILSIQLNLSDDIIMKDQTVEVSGRVIVSPEGWPVPQYTAVTIQSWEQNPRVVYTDQDGRFSTSLNPPGTIGRWTVTASCEDENGITGSTGKMVSVRELVYSDIRVLEADGETDGILNPGENYRILVRIREKESESSYYVVTSSDQANPFQVTVDGQGPYYLVIHNPSEGVWSTATRTAENQLGLKQHDLFFSGTSSNGISGSSPGSLSYTIKCISISLSFDNVVNPGDNTPILGRAVLLPDGMPLISNEIQVRWGETSTTVRTDDNGRFTYLFPAPAELNLYTITFEGTAGGGIKSENSCVIWVKTIQLNLQFDKPAYTQYDNVTLTVTATLLPDGWPIPELQVRLYGGGLDNEIWQTTFSDGTFTCTFPISENARRTGMGEVYAWTSNADGIIGYAENTYYVGQPVQVRGVLRNAENAPLRPLLSFHSLTTEGCVINVTPDAGGNYSKVLIKGVYDLYIITPTFTVILHNITNFQNAQDWENFENIIRLDNFPPVAANIPDVSAKLIGFFLEAPQLNFNGVTMLFNYSSMLGQISSEDKLVVFRSADWDFGGRSGSFGLVAGTINKVTHTVTTSSSTLSAYVLAESTYSFEQLSSQLQSAAGGVSSAASSLQGAASRMEGAVAQFENVVAQMSLGELVISDPASIFLELQQGENLNLRISLRNRTTTPMTLTPRIAGDLVGILTVKENSVQLDSLSGGSLNLHVEVLPTQPIGNVNGSVVLDGKIGNYTLPSLREIPVNLKVVPPEKSLLDLRLSPVQTSVKPGSVASISLNMLNIGKLPWVDTQLVLRVIGPDGKVVFTKIENLSFETALSKIFDFKLPSNLPEGDYRVEAEAQYRCNGRTYSASSITGFELRSEAPKEISLFGMAMSSIFAALATGGLAAGTGIIIYRWERSRMKVKRRFEHLVAFAELPPAEDSAWAGHLAETKRRAFFKFDDLMTHMIVAGATGSGKTIAAMDLAEEALLNKKNVIVVDPTAQWTGFLRKCKEEKMIRYFSKFGISHDQAHGFPGRIIQVVDPNMKVDVSRMIRDPNGRIYIFVVERLRPEQLDLFIQNLIQAVFDARLEESPKLRTLLIFDEVHRLLPRFGGAGKGVVQLERGVREFRKWGVGIVLVSQVISDFEREIRANIRNQIQLWTRDEEELARITEKFGAEYMRSISRASVGHGMYFNPDYNKGKPYFINFRPILHQVSRMSAEELDRYTSASARVDGVRQKIEALEKIGVDTFEQRTELELTERKLEEGAFDMVDFYLESLEPSVDRLLERHGLKGVLETKPAEQAPEQPPAEKPAEKAEVPVLESYKQAVAPMLKGGKTRRRSKGARR